MATATPGRTAAGSNPFRASDCAHTTTCTPLNISAGQSHCGRVAVEDDHDLRAGRHQPQRDGEGEERRRPLQPRRRLGALPFELEDGAGPPRGLRHTHGSEGEHLRVRRGVRHQRPKVLVTGVRRPGRGRAGASPNPQLPTVHFSWGISPGRDRAGRGLPAVGVVNGHHSRINSNRPSITDRKASCHFPFASEAGRDPWARFCGSGHRQFLCANGSETQAPPRE